MLKHDEEELYHHLHLPPLANNPLMFLPTGEILAKQGLIQVYQKLSIIYSCSRIPSFMERKSKLSTSNQGTCCLWNFPVLHGRYQVFRNSASLQRCPPHKIKKAWTCYSCCLGFSSSAYSPGKPLYHGQMSISVFYQILSFCTRQLNSFLFCISIVAYYSFPHTPLLTYLSHH